MKDGSYEDTWTEIRHGLFIAAFFALVIALASWFAPKAHAGHRCVAAAKVVVQTQFVAVPVATPVGYPAYVSPVANVGMVAYGSAQQQQASTAREAKSIDTPVPPSPDGVPYETYLAQFAQYLNVKNGAAFQPQVGQPPQPQAAAPKVSLVSQHCASCHNTAKPEGKLDMTGALSSDVRLKSIQRILTDDHALSMPKGKVISDQQRGELIAELTAVP